MKRLFILILTFIMCLTFFIVPVSADSYDSYDSRYLTSEEKAILSVPYNDVALLPDDTVIKLYMSGGSNFFRFKNQEDITTIVESAIAIRYLLVSGDFEMRHYKEIYGGVGITKTPQHFAQWEGFYTYTVYPELVFGSSVKVNKIYCLDGFGKDDCGYIYYDTDHGEYILFSEYTYEGETYLFPLSYFYEFTKMYDRSFYEVINMEGYVFNDTPHDIHHPDADEDRICDLCGYEPVSNCPFFPVPGIHFETVTQENDESHEAENSSKMTSESKETEITIKPTDDNKETEVTANSIDESVETDVSIKPADESKETDKAEGGCDSSVALPAAVAVGVIGTAFIFKKKKSRTKCKERTVE